MNPAHTVDPIGQVFVGRTHPKALDILLLIDDHDQSMGRSRAQIRTNVAKTVSQSQHAAPSGTAPANTAQHTRPMLMYGLPLASSPESRRSGIIGKCSLIARNEGHITRRWFTFQGSVLDSLATVATSLCLILADSSDRKLRLRMQSNRVFR